MTLDLPRDEALEVYARCKTLRATIEAFQDRFKDQLDEIEKYIDGQNGWRDELDMIKDIILGDLNSQIQDSLDPLIKEADHCFEDSFPPEKPYFTRDLEPAE